MNFEKVKIMGIYQPSNEMRTFNTTKNSGDFGEDSVKQYLIRKYNCKIKDVSDIVEFRKKDIDFLYSIDGKGWTSVEVKTDNRMSKTGNIVVENAMFRKKGRVNGWLYYCEAHILCFVDDNNYVFYFFDWDKLRKEIKKGRWEKRWFKNGTDNCNGEVYVIPLKELFELGNIVLFSDKLF